MIQHTVTGDQVLSCLRTMKYIIAKVTSTFKKPFHLTSFGPEAISKLIFIPIFTYHRYELGIRGIKALLKLLGILGLHNYK